MLFIMKRLTIFTLCLLLSLVIGCTSSRYTSYKYTVSQGFALSSITRDKEVTLPITDNVCYDNGLRFITFFDGIKTALSIQNNSGNSVKILWDDGALIDQENFAHRIVHAGISITDKEKAQVPSVIPNDSLIEDTIYAADCLKWNAGKGSWDYLPIVWDKEFTNEADANQYIRNMAPVKLMLPIETDGRVTEYLITFNEKDSKLTSSSRKGLTTGTIVAFGVVGALITVYAVGILNDSDFSL